MSILALIILALGLSMDSFAVSLSSGVALKPFKISNVLKIALYLSFFQAVMPVIGWFLGVGFVDIIHSIDHWIAFVLLLFLGGKMIFDVISPKEEEEQCCFNPTKTTTLIQMSIATSIDALAVGVSFACLKVQIVWAVLFIGVITFALSAVGVKVGSIFGAKYKSKAEFAGGLVLIIIGVKILLEGLGVIA